MMVRKILINENILSIRFVSFWRQWLIFWEVVMFVLIGQILEKRFDFATGFDCRVFSELLRCGFKDVILVRVIIVLNGTGIIFFIEIHRFIYILCNTICLRNQVWIKYKAKEQIFFIQQILYHMVENVSINKFLLFKCLHISIRQTILFFPLIGSSWSSPVPSMSSICLSWKYLMI